MTDLVLTGIPEFWPEDDHRAVFLGPWCFSGHPRYRFWDQTRFTLAPSPWGSKNDVLGASLYVESLIDRVFPVLSTFLNGWHGTGYSERFWRVYLIRWIVHWMGNAYERFRRLEHLGRSFPGERFRVKALAHPEVVRSADYGEFSELFPDHRANLALFSQIIHLAEFPFLDPVVSQILAVSSRVEPPIRSPQEAGPLFQGLGERPRRASWIPGSGLLSSLDYVRGISWVERLGLLPSVLAQGKVEPRCQAGGEDPPKQAAQRHSDCVLKFEPCNLFEEIVSRIILEHLPRPALHLPQDLRQEVQRTRIWVGSDTWNADVNYRIAAVVESGGRWLAVQHGAGYGQNLSLPQGKIEYETADGFMSWGWRTQKTHGGTIHPLPSRELSQLPPHREKRREVVFVGRMVPAYTFRLHSILFPEDLLPYLMSKKRFFEALRPEILSSVYYRAFPKDYGVGEREWVGSVLRSDQIREDGPLSIRMNEARLVVVDHLGTSIQECLAMGVPFICFWEPEHFRESEAAQPFFDQLRTAGILHNRPEDAARKVNEVWESPRDWLEDRCVREARDQFRRQYALTSRRWRRDWVKFMKEYIRQDGPDRRS